ncbi:MAG TPA: AcrB/AcrD/AcrF family protein [Clostridiales bacterium]|jgi:multidrug efflux pump subunit AcrB|nr:AcrB/AcrD/AcrF family protein [Clostridiales bacterium]
MNFGKFSIEKKYVILSLAIAIIIFGLYGRATMNTQLSPDTNAPTATVMSVYPGASAMDVSTDVSEPMEDAFAKLEGITDIKITNQDNISTIRLTFDYSTDIDQAAIDIQNTISRIKESLPDNLNEPQVMKFSTSDQPIMTIGLKSNSLSMSDLRSVTEEKLVYELQLIEGIASVDIFGGYSREVKIDLDEDKMNAYNLNLEQIIGTIQKSNIKSPSGEINYNSKDMLLRIEESYANLDEIENTKITLADGNTLYLRDVGDVSIGIEDKESAYRLKGEESLALLITKKADFNTVNVVDEIKDNLSRIESDYPFVDINIASDDSIFTNQMVDNMTSSVVLAIVFTIAVILLFIGNISQSLVVSISMPMVFLSTLGLMRAFGMSLDLVTLSALILSIGFVVDAAIVVVENISKHRGMGKSIDLAVVDGTQEVALPSIAGATTTLIVLVPLLFVQGFVGEMFRPLSTTLIFAISSSLIIALLLIPLLTKLLEPLKMKRFEKGLNKFSDPFNKSMDKLMNWYLKLSKTVLSNKLVTFILIVVLLGGSGMFIKNNGMEMLPKFDSGISFATIEMKAGTTIEDTSKTISKIENYLAKEPEVVTFDTRIGYEEGSTQMGDFGIMGTDQGMLTIELTSRKERSESIWEFQERLRTYIKKLPDINRFVVKEKGGTAVTSASAPISLKISGENLNVLYNLADTIQEEIETVEGTTNLYRSYNDTYSQMSINLDKDRLKELGLTSADVSKQLYMKVEGGDAGSITLENTSVDIDVSYDTSNITEDELMNKTIISPLGVSVPLKDIGRVEVETRSNIIERENMEYSVNILGYTEDRAFSHVVSDIQEKVDEIPLPQGYNVEFTGEQEALTDSMGDMIFLLSLAVIFVYLLLVPQFKSFLHPLTIMMAIPLVVIGVAPALGLTGKFMSMPVLLGLILLAGTVVNNSILLVDSINGERTKGASINAAVEEGIRSRFRPIMMTALSDVVGMMPLALQLALGSERFSPLAITVIGGILAATFLTIIVIPLIYASFETGKEKFFGFVYSGKVKEDVV